MSYGNTDPIHGPRQSGSARLALLALLAAVAIDDLDLDGLLDVLVCDVAANRVS